MTYWVRCAFVVVACLVVGGCSPSSNSDSEGREGAAASGDGAQWHQGSASFSQLEEGVVGAIDDASWQREGLRLSGWACDVGVSQSVDIHVYAGGPAATGSLVIGHRAADILRESGVGSVCRTSGVAHGFDFVIPRALLGAYAGKSVFVHAISLRGASNQLLHNSGAFSLPASLQRVMLLSQKLAGLSGDRDLTIGPDESVTIDTSAEVGLLTIQGRLMCPPSGAGTLTAAGISVEGPDAVFECGTPQRRFDGQFSILLKGGRSAGHHGERSIGVMDGGQLRLFGRAKNFGWLRLGAPITAASSRVELESPVDWSPGETIAIGSTSFNFDEAEERTIATVSADRRSVTVTQPFSFAHGAFRRTYTQGSRTWTLDERAEAANLTRNIVIAAAGDPVALDAEQMGAHVMVMMGGEAYVDGVEFVRGGQLGVMARYPFHWHLAGDVSGQFIKNSSVHHSYQRCITVHGTNRSLVENNVCFDHFGHGYFFENGNEVDNVMVGNLGMKSKRVPAGKGLLFSDMTSRERPRFSAPATFWITNPQNVIRNNVASGSQGTGFWMSFSRGLKCGADFRCQGVAGGPGSNVFPARADTTEFSFNVAHSSEVGITWDGAEDGPTFDNPLNPVARQTESAHYQHGATVPTFQDLVAFKNVASGIYFRGNEARFPGAVAADNGYSLFFAYNQVVTDGLVVGASAGLTAAEVAWARALPPEIALNSLEGIRIYDGPFSLKNVHFADFVSMPERTGALRAWPFVNVGGANRSVNRTEGLTFDPQPQERMALAGAAQSFPSLGWSEMPWTTAVRDLDGSLSGVANGLIVPNHPLNFSAPECAPLSPAVGSGYACTYDWGVLTFAESDFPAPYSPISFPFKVERIEEATGTTVTSGPLEGLWHNKTGLIVGPRYRYRLISTVGINVVRARWGATALSPVLEWVGVAPQCRPNGVPQMASRAALSSSTTAGYAWEGGAFFIRMAPGLVELSCQ